MANGVVFQDRFCIRQQGTCLQRHFQNLLELFHVLILPDGYDRTLPGQPKLRTYTCTTLLVVQDIPSTAVYNTVEIPELKPCSHGQAPGQIGPNNEVVLIILKKDKPERDE